ncbi:MAG: FAD synthase [Alistipes sp.]|nr:FAD synthase [Alistipes sp.]
MQILHGYQLKIFDQASIVTVGSFDGVHRGHQALLTQLTEQARTKGLRSVVVTFEPHPRIALGRSEGFELLTENDEKAAWLAHYGVDTLVMLPFDAQLASLSGVDFAKSILQQQLHAKMLVAGYNHRFGHDRLAASDLSLPGLELIEVGPFEVAGLRVSSTIIRKLIAAGDYTAAEQLLGHPIKRIEQ